MYYTYAHIRLDTNAIFYIGKGTGRRLHKTVGHSPHWHHIVNKHGYKAIKLCDWELEKDALQHEICLIKYLRNKGLSLVNITSGGEGVSGVKCSDATKLKISASLIGRPLSEEHKLKISIASAKYRHSEETKLKSNTGRQRANISGALDAETHEAHVQEHVTLNAETTIKFFKFLENKNPKAPSIYLILDNAGYYKGEKIREYLKTSRIKLVFLPPYAPNLNLIERLWKFFKKKVLYNQYYKTFLEFRDSCLSFFKKSNLNKFKKELSSLLTDHFQIVSAE
jgi:transposase